MRDRPQELKRRAVGGGPDDGMRRSESLSSILRGVFCERSWLPKSSSSGGFACALGRHCGLPAKTSGRFWPCRVIVLCQAIFPREMRIPSRKRVTFFLSLWLIETSDPCRERGIVQNDRLFYISVRLTIFCSNILRTKLLRVYKQKGIKPARPFTSRKSHPCVVV